MLVWTTVALGLGLVAATPMTVVVAANQEECFYGEVSSEGVRVGFSYAVQAGGQFDIDFRMIAPDGEVLYETQKESQADYTFAARTIGEYLFCFSNDMSTFSDKTVEFDLDIDSDFRATLPERVGSEDTDRIYTSLTKIDGKVGEMMRSLMYYRTRNYRNESTVKSTEARIYYFSIFEILLMIGMGLLNVTIVQLFFRGSRKHLV